jgi:16S rRNA (adenine1518-N6/adenine1519-N6)-dimethyltransferase
MNLTSPTIIKELLAKYETRPSKGLGQNFLIDKNVLRKIVEASDIKPTDIILEVGPGIGVLTQELAQFAKKIISVEKSETMCEILKETIKDFKNVEVINDDILQYKLKLPMGESKYKVVANIPYYLTSPLIRKFLEEKNPPQEIVLMIQKEVAQRVCTSPPHMNLLAVSVQFYADIKIISYVSNNCFWPAPKIDSAIIKITPKNNKEKNIIVINKFFEVVKAGFSQPRKQLGGNLSKILELKKEGLEKWLLKNNIKPTQRAETLSIEDWKNLAATFTK